MLERLEKWFGSLVVSRLLGCLIGLFVGSMIEIDAGRRWRHENGVPIWVQGLVLGGLVGLTAGWIIDATVTDEKRRWMLIYTMWWLVLVFGIFAAFLAPALF
jgi:high-affinity Fe2+/Pb2+ permease